MYFKNNSNAPVYAHFTYWKPRKDVMKTANITSLKALMTQGFTAYGGSSTTYQLKEQTEFMNPDWCHFFKCYRSTKQMLHPGVEVMKTITNHKSYIWRTDFDQQDTSDGGEFLAYAGRTKFLHVRLLGSLTFDVAGGVSYKVDTSNLQVAFRTERKYSSWYTSDSITAHFGHSVFAVQATPQIFNEYTAAEQAIAAAS